MTLPSEGKEVINWRGTPFTTLAFLIPLGFVIAGLVSIFIINFMDGKVSVLFMIMGLIGMILASASGKMM